MTWLMSSTCRPRAARLVAIRTLISPLRNWSSVRSRSRCERSPWIAATFCPRRLRSSKQLVDAALGVAEHEDLIGLPAAQKLRERLWLVLIEDLDVDLLDRLEVHLTRVDRDLRRILREAMREIAHFA